MQCFVAAVAGLVALLLTLPVVIIAVPFFVVSWATQRLARFLEPQYMGWGELIEFEPEIGWQPKANLETHHLTDDVFGISTDSQGWRGRTTLRESQIVIFGDSFAWGYGTDDKHFFANLLPELKMKAIGTIGYNMVQELLWMRRLAPQLRGKLVVWFIYLGNDLCDNLVPDMCGYRTPFVRTVNGAGSWEIVTSHIRAAKWIDRSELVLNGRDYYTKLAELCSQTYFSERAYSACRHLLNEGAELCREAGSHLVVVTIPDMTQMSSQGVSLLLNRCADSKSFDPDYPDREIKRICDDLGIRHIALKDHLSPSDYKKADCHWNRKGHRKVAEVIRRSFVKSTYELQFDQAQHSSTPVPKGSQPDSELYVASTN